MAKVSSGMVFGFEGMSFYLGVDRWVNSFLPYRKLRCKTHGFTSSLSELAENAKHSFLTL